MSRLYVDRISPYQSASIEIDGLDTSNLTTKTTFNSYTSSNDSKVTSLINATGSYAKTNVANTFTAGPQLVSGSSGYVTQQFTAPAAGNEYPQTKIVGADNGGTAYNRVFQGVLDYSNFGLPNTEDAFAIEYFNSTGYNYGTQFYLNGISTELAVTPNGGGAGNQAKIKLQDDGDNTSTLSMKATDISIGTTGTANISIGSSAGALTINSGNFNIAAQDPLPAGNVGDLAVSGSNLFFYNGAWTQVV